MRRATICKATLLSLCAVAALTFPSATPRSRAAVTNGNTGAAASPADLARDAFKAQGGESFRSLKSLLLAGSADLYSPNSTRGFPAQFVLVTAGDRTRLEIRSSAFNLRHIYDGTQNFTSIRNMQLPPGTLGLSMLRNFDRPGFTVGAPADAKKAGFRISNQDGDSTDFYVNAQGRVQSCVINYKGSGSAIEYKSLKEMNGVLVPYQFVQKLQTPQGAFFAEFKVKEVKVNQPLGDDMFAITEQ